eukprot:4796714-Pleurochrysis_carterae.AAC.1
MAKLSDVEEEAKLLAGCHYETRQTKLCDSGLSGRICLQSQDQKAVDLTDQKAIDITELRSCMAIVRGEAKGHDWECKLASHCRHERKRRPPAARCGGKVSNAGVGNGEAVRSEREQRSGCACFNARGIDECTTFCTAARMRLSAVPDSSAPLFTTEAIFEAAEGFTTTQLARLVDARRQLSLANSQNSVERDKASQLKKVVAL